MAIEHSCGILVIRKHGEGRDLLLIQNRSGGHWGFPKGHIEPGETEDMTARREVWEETGLAVEPLAEIRTETRYRMPNGNEKHVVYFAGIYQENGELHAQEAELTDLGWVPLEQAADRLTYDGDRRVLADMMEDLVRL